MYIQFKEVSYGYIIAFYNVYEVWFIIFLLINMVDLRLNEFPEFVLEPLYINLLLNFKRINLNFVVSTSRSVEASIFLNFEHILDILDTFWLPLI